MFNTYIYVSPIASYMFRCLLRYLRGDYCVICCKTVFYLQYCYQHGKKHIVFERVAASLQKAYSFWVSYNNIAKKRTVFEQVTTLQKVWFLSKLQQHCKKHTAFERVTTTLPKNIQFLSKLQQHCKGMVFEQVTATLHKSIQLLSKLQQHYQKAYSFWASYNIAKSMVLELS